jgi:hypothetical protein
MADSITAACAGDNSPDARLGAVGGLGIEVGERTPTFYSPLFFAVTITYVTMMGDTFTRDST